MNKKQDFWNEGMALLKNGNPYRAYPKLYASLPRLDKRTLTLHAIAEQLDAAQIFQNNNRLKIKIREINKASLAMVKSGNRAKRRIKKILGYYVPLYGLDFERVKDNP